MKRWFVTAFVATAVVLVISGSAVQAAPPPPGDKKLSADPATFVGKADDCGTPYPAGSNIVTAAWLGGIGLPDDGTSPNTPSKDKHSGLLLSKNGPTSDCSAAGATIKGVKDLMVTDASTFMLGFDYRNGGHCGGGAPRFNIVTDDGMFHFSPGCASGVAIPAPQDPDQWTTIRLAGSSAIPPLLSGTKIKSLEIILDEGTDATSVQDLNGVGLAVIDNIFVDGDFITTGKGIEDPK